MNGRAKEKRREKLVFEVCLTLEYVGFSKGLHIDFSKRVGERYKQGQGCLKLV